VLNKSKTGEPTWVEALVYIATLLPSSSSEMDFLQCSVCIARLLIIFVES
jgi:hypothetical protein